MGVVTAAAGFGIGDAIDEHARDVSWLLSESVELGECVCVCDGAESIFIGVAVPVPPVCCTACVCALRVNAKHGNDSLQLGCNDGRSSCVYLLPRCGNDAACCALTRSMT